MSTGLPLFDQQGTAGTRRAAGESIAPELQRLQDEVLGFVRERGLKGVTDEEIRVGLGLSGDTCRARRCELRDLGLVTDSGKRRKTASGRAAVVWIATDRPATGARAPTRSAVPAEPAAEARAVDAPAGEASTEVEVCASCGGHRFHDLPIHAGQSVRRDCAECGAFVAFVLWHGSSVKPKRRASVMGRRAAGDMMEGV